MVNKLEFLRCYSIAFNWSSKGIDCLLNDVRVLDALEKGDFADSSWWDTVVFLLETNFLEGDYFLSLLVHCFEDDTISALSKLLLLKVIVNAALFMNKTSALRVDLLLLSVLLLLGHALAGRIVVLHFIYLHFVVACLLTVDRFVSLFILSRDLKLETI